MPARFVYWMNVSVDGYIEAHPGEHSGPEAPGWIRIDEPLHQEFNDRARAMTMSIEGRVVRDMMDPYWPDARYDEDSSPVEREYGEIWTAQPKVLVSRTRTEAGHGTRVIGADGDAIAQLAAIRADGAGDIGVGGANLATQLLDAGLIDELLLFVHPAVLGSGRPLFDPPATGSRPPLLLDLLETKAFANGVVLHRYAVQH
ncbi:dihydrofolate reductase family protein [Curtobacterium caseinilyticum]|uniref:Dihydrofolate reductase family protein n=1 Tax=Curtobacterium caseinilyticum TaxID=3055137 RepID=A0ABT7TU94_9MICO|nr:dihydrofolate reductase family protein [Curtobacterium caseinilyticum]MDM7893184.1 dihydrofolate reductase family protein [Curtobacterium caseinilyticum]